MIATTRRRVMGGGGGGYPPDALMTIETNPEVLAVCYAQGWCSHANYMTYTEAAAVTNIGTAFYNNKNITHFEELEFFGIASIGSNCFRNTTNLKTLVLPISVTSLGNDALRSSGIETLTILSLNISSWGNAYTFVSSSIKTMYSNSSTTTPIGANLSKLETLQLGSNVRTVGGFSNATQLTSVTIAEGATTFYDNCFKNCSSLGSITLPSTTSVMTHGVFNTCAALTSVTILATTPPTGISNYTFQNSPNAIIYVPSESVSAYQSASGWSQYASRIQAIQ